MENLRSEYHVDMLNIYKEAKKVGYTPSYFLQMVEEHGGYEAAIILIHKDEVTSGFTKLWELKRLDLSAEALILRRKYRGLFNEEERQICRQRLEQYKFDVSSIN